VTAPAVFISHGAPTAAVAEDDYAAALRALGDGLGTPPAALVVSAHWEARGAWRVNARSRPELIYDFYGFPPRLYALHYPASGAPELAAQAAELLGAAGLEVELEGRRGWDHGVWVPLRLMWPEARVPIVALSLPAPRSESELLSAGRALAGLRERGVVVIGSGGIVHNLHGLRWEAEHAPAEPWAAAFEAWVRERLLRREHAALRAYREQAPSAALAVPTSEHLDPLFVVLGAAEHDTLTDVYRGFRYGCLSLWSFRLDPPAATPAR
jgi:4,5-DOPA dioxygenase extradiol